MLAKAAARELEPPLTSILALARRVFSGTRLVDAGCLLVVFLAGSTIGSRYISTFQQHYSGEYGQAQFGAAVALACGHGFVNPVGGGPALDAFLDRKSDTFSCGDLRPQMTAGTPNFTQGLYRYLMTAVALQWKWSGISWSRLPPLFGIVFGTTLCAAYALFRFAGGPLVGLLGVIPLAVSAHGLGMLPSLRDFSKAPFILLLMAITARLAMPPYSRVKTLVLSGLFGVALGIGFGFRNDLMICVPPFIAVIACLLPVRWREEWRTRAACVALAAALFTISAWPILRAYSAGSNTGHVAVLGLTSGFDFQMGMTRPPYDIGTHYLDGYAGLLIDAHSYIHQGHFVEYLSPEYDKAAFRLIVDVTRHWPADMFARALGATLQVFDFPFTVGRFSSATPAGIVSPDVLSIYDRQMDYLRELSGLGPFAVALALVLIGSSSPRAAIALIVFALYYCGYPAVQFQERHFFHLEFVAWWALLYCVAAFFRTVGARVRLRPLPRTLKQRAVGSAVTIAAMAVIPIAPLVILRVYQQHHVQQLFRSYSNTPRVALATSRTTVGQQVVIVAGDLWKGRNTDPRAPITFKYLVVEFSSTQCPAVDLPVTLKYNVDASNPNDFSTTTHIPIDARGPTYQFAPIFYNGWSHFESIIIPAGYDSCLKSVSMFSDFSRTPVPVDFRLTPNMPETSWFQRLRNWENSVTTADPRVFAVPEELVAPSPSGLTSVSPAVADRVDEGVARAAGGRGWTGTVKASVPQALLLHFKEQDVAEGSMLRVSGRLRRGGLLIGALKNDQWLNMRGIEEPGPFIVLIRPGPAGRYGALVTDFSTREWRLEPFSLQRRASRYVAPWLLTDDFDVDAVEWVQPTP